MACPCQYSHQLVSLSNQSQLSQFLTANLILPHKSLIHSFHSIHKCWIPNCHILTNNSDSPINITIIISTYTILKLHSFHNTLFLLIIYFSPIRNYNSKQSFQLVTQHQYSLHSNTQTRLPFTRKELRHFLARKTKIQSVVLSPIPSPIGHVLSLTHWSCLSN